MELVDYGARWYDAGLGRFLSPDTIIPDPANPQSFNRYSYVYNNPVKYTDSTGHCAEFGDDACWSEYDRLKHDCPECETTVTADGIVPLHEANQDRLKAYRDAIENPSDYSDILAAIEGAQLSGEIVAGLLCEPCDWGITGIHWAQGDFHPADLAGLLPLLPATAVGRFGRALDKLEDATQDLGILLTLKRVQ